MLIAVALTLVGFAIEVGSGHRELGTVFALSFAAGCVAAVLLVRQSSVFTAVISPPLLLSVAVPLAYFLMHGSEVKGLKGFLITCGYPLIERFPLMLFTSAVVLLIGMARWYSATSVHSQVSARAQTGGPRAGLLAGLVARFTAERPPRHSIERRTPARAPRPARDRPARASDAGRGEPAARRASARRPVREAGPAERRRQRPVPEPGWAPEPRHRVPRDRRDPRPVRSRRGTDYDPRPAYPAYDPYSPRPTRARHPDDTRHPVSRVRYRGGGPYPDYPPPRGR